MEDTELSMGETSHQAWKSSSLPGSRALTSLLTLKVLYSHYLGHRLLGQAEEGPWTQAARERAVAGVFAPFS